MINNINQSSSRNETAMKSWERLKCSCPLIDLKNVVSLVEMNRSLSMFRPHYEICLKLFCFCEETDKVFTSWYATHSLWFTSKCCHTCCMSWGWSAKMWEWWLYQWRLQLSWLLSLWTQHIGNLLLDILGVGKTTHSLLIIQWKHKHE